MYILNFSAFYVGRECSEKKLRKINDQSWNNILKVQTNIGPVLEEKN